MHRNIRVVLCLAAGLILSNSSAAAQLPPAKRDPLGAAQAPQGAKACSATDASSCAEAAAKILPLVMGPSPMEENLRRLTDEVGGRVTGSPEMAKAVEWAVGAFRAAGVDVHTEKYTLPVTWSEGETRLELLGPVKFHVKVISEGWSPATPAGGIEANVLDVGYGKTTRMILQRPEASRARFYWCTATSARRGPISSMNTYCRPGLSTAP